VERLDRPTPCLLSLGFPVSRGGLNLAKLKPLQTVSSNGAVHTSAWPPLSHPYRLSVCSHWGAGLMSSAAKRAARRAGIIQLTRQLCSKASGENWTGQK